MEALTGCGLPIPPSLTLVEGSSNLLPVQAPALGNPNPAERPMQWRRQRRQRPWRRRPAHEVLRPCAISARPACRPRSRCRCSPPRRQGKRTRAPPEGVSVPAVSTNNSVDRKSLNATGTLLGRPRSFQQHHRGASLRPQGGRECIRTRDPMEQHVS